MGMHPELKHALDSGASILEVIELFKKHHYGPEEEQFHLYYAPSQLWAGRRHHDFEFWYTWAPLHGNLELSNHHHKPSLRREKCTLDIHKALTKEVISWACDSEKKSNVYLIAEPRVEHSRGAALANICSSNQRFTRTVPRGLKSSSYDDIGFLIAELASSYHPFRRILTRILIDNPGIVELPLRTRFKKLIHEPWKELQESHPQYATAPPVILFRWSSKKHDEELFRSICEFGSLRYPSPLLWIISIDPQFKLPFQDFLDPLAPIRYFRLPIYYDEGPTDTELVLHYKFSAFRHKRNEIFGDDEVWPSQEQMSQLIRIVSGVFEFVDVIIQFVDWMDDGGPRAHLEAFLAYMLDSPSPSDDQPYCALDHCYIHALSNIPPDLLSVVKRSFSIIRYLDENNSIDPIDLVCTLSLGNDSFLPHLKRLAVIEYGGSYIFSKPFKRFLEDPNRSGHFYTPKSESRLHAFQVLFHFLRHSSCLSLLQPQMVQRIQTDSNAYEHLRHLACAKLCTIQDVGVGWTSLRHFDFSCLAYTCDKIPINDFPPFLRRLHAWDKANPVNIVRVEPMGPLDRKFIAACQILAEPLDLEEEQVYDVWSARRPKYVLLGYESETVLVVLDSHLQIYPDSGVNIYTSAMLDYM